MKTEVATGCGAASARRTSKRRLLRLAGYPHCLFLDSALRDPRLGRYSFLTADPFELFHH